MKTFNIMYNIGKCKYVVNYHDGEKKHDDGSPFFDIEIFTQYLKMHKFVAGLVDNGYKEK